MKTTRAILYRMGLPWRMTVTVGPITVGAFMGLVRAVAHKASEVRTLARRDITGEDLIRAFREPEFLAFADAVVKGRPSEFFGAWLSTRNLLALMDASARVNDWRRILSCLNLSGEKPKRRGSLMGDIQIICRMFPGLDPMSVEDWPMEKFLTFCESLNLMQQGDDPTADPECRPTAMQGLAGLPGLGIVH